jgi:cytosine/adenosine deaminase-related metal-dependent hydrolase
MLIRNGRPWGHDGVADILVQDGTIAAIGPGLAAPEDIEVVDATGQVVLPGLVDAHCHLDKTLYGRPWEPHSADDTLAGRIGNDRRRRHELGIPDAAAVRALLRAMAGAGTAYARTHTDVDPEVGLSGLETVRAVADELAAAVTVEQVAFPQHGLLTFPGTAELVEEALRAGLASAVGGVDPAGMDRDPVRHLDVVFGLAERYGAAVDLHLHDGGSLGAWEIELIAERTRTTGLRDRVTISHAYALGQVDAPTQARLADLLADAGVGITTCAVYSFPVPPVRTLRAAGVTVACGHDGIRDLWGPYGSGDMLERAMHLAYRSTFRRDEDVELALHAATYGGAAALGLPAYGLAVGAPADLVLVEAATPAEAVVVHPPRRLVVKAGRRR